MPGRVLTQITVPQGRSSSSTLMVQHNSERMLVFSSTLRHPTFWNSKLQRLCGAASPKLVFPLRIHQKS